MTLFTVAEDYLKRLEQHVVRDAGFALADVERLLGNSGPTSPDRPVKAEAKLVQPKLNLADYIAAEAEPPPVVDRTAFLAYNALRDVLGNDQWGDCGDAMTLHAIEAMHVFAQTPVPQFVTGDALTLYSAVSGFNPNAGPPGANPTDTGTDNQQLVDFWRDHGVVCAADGSNHKIAGSLFVDPKDKRVSMLAVWEFVVLFRAVGLPRTAESQNDWKVTDPSLQGDAAVGSWGYHDIPYLSYDQNQVHCDTWGEDKLVDWDWDKDYGVQGFVVVTQDQLNLQGVSPAGVDWTKLNADMAKFPPAPSN